MVSEYSSWGTCNWGKLIFLIPFFPSDIDSENHFTAVAPPVFKGEGYHVWVARMEAHIEENDPWKAYEEEYGVCPLPANPTMVDKESQGQENKKINGYSDVICYSRIWIFC